MRSTQRPLLEVAALFVRLGATAFGGPAAHVAMMEDEVVRRRGWLSREVFLDYLGATNLIPGPNSTELAIHIGRARAGWPGLVVAGACFILPAATIVTAMAWGYVTYGKLPAFASVMSGVKPVVVAVVAQALWGLGRTAVKSAWLAGVGVAATVASVASAHEVAILATAGASCAVRRSARPRGAAAVLTATPLSASAGATVAAAASGASPFGLWPLFVVFAKIGSVLFGSGYVLLAFMRADLVERLGWLSEAQLIDAIAVGQVTPGPVFTAATFVGYVLGGLPGAAAATVGIFLPAFVFVAASGPLVPRLRRSATAGAVLDGVNVASLALMAVVCWQLARVALMDPLTWLVAIVAAWALFVKRVNSAWLVVAGGLTGWAASLVGR
jgi:chromate transporter